MLCVIFIVGKNRRQLLLRSPFLIDERSPYWGFPIPGQQWPVGLGAFVHSYTTLWPFALDPILPTKLI